jgi:uncharacterized protein YheU (UPF0270 family)
MSIYSAYQGEEGRKKAEEYQRAALNQQQSDANLMRQELARQTTEYAKQGASLEQQAQTARQALEAQQGNYASNKLEMERKAAEVTAAMEEERRKAGEAQASALKARTRGGRRSLLSSARMDAELGIPMDLGGTGVRIQ